MVQVAGDWEAWGTSKLSNAIMLKCCERTPGMVENESTVHGD